MPELPELEIAKRQLDRWASGRPLRGFELLDAAVVRSSLSTLPSDAVADPAGALKPLVGRSPEMPIRRGKRLAWPFGDVGVLLHLGMSGKWVRRDPGAEGPKHARLKLDFGDNVLWYRDPRRWGCVTDVRPTRDLLPVLGAGLGPDALLAPLDGPALAARMARTKQPVKLALMDQARLAGLGNIQVAEVLWRAGVDPNTPCPEVTPALWAAIAAAIPVQLEAAIAEGDGEELTYVSDGAESPFAVYGRLDQPCLKCKTPIRAEVLGARTTYWCPTCQPTVTS